jgi:hypothetical protein
MRAQLVNPVARNEQNQHPRLMLTGPQCRAARGLLGWSIADLVKASGVSARSVHTAESSPGIPTTMNIQTVAKLQAAFEAAGVEIIEPGTRSLSGGPGVRLRRSYP